MTAHTHVGFSRQTGYVRRGKLVNHRDNAGKIHALVGSTNICSGGKYAALCGETVEAEHDGEEFNVWIGSGVTCKRCRALIK